MTAAIQGIPKQVLKDQSSYYGIAIIDAGAIVVRNGTTNRIEVYSHDYNKINEFDLPAGMHKGIAATQDGNILVCDSSNGCIREYGVDGTLHRVIQNKEMENPSYVATHNSNIIVSCAGEEPCIIKLMADGSFIWHCDEIDFPQGIDVDKNGDIYVCDLENKQVTMLTPDGCTAFTMVRPDQLGHRLPSMVAVHEDRLAVKFMDSNIVQRFQLS